MKIMAIDPSLRSTGVVVVDGEYNKQWTIDPIEEERCVALNILFNEIEDIDVIEDPKVIIIEDYPYHIKNTKSLTTMAEVRGAIICAVGWMSTATIIELPISVWKSQTIGSIKKQTKKEKEKYLKIANEFLENHNIEADNCDTADAFLMIIAAKKILETEGGTEAVKRIRKELKEAIGDSNS